MSKQSIPSSNRRERKNKKVGSLKKQSTFYFAEMNANTLFGVKVGEKVKIDFSNAENKSTSKCHLIDAWERIRMERILNTKFWKVKTFILNSPEVDYNKPLRNNKMKKFLKITFNEWEEVNKLKVQYKKRVDGIIKGYEMKFGQVNEKKSTKKTALISLLIYFVENKLNIPCRYSTQKTFKPRQELFMRGV